MNRIPFAVLGILVSIWTSSALCESHDAQIDESLSECHEGGLFNGSVLVAKGDTTAAIQNYLKSLDLNPKNQNARNMVERLQGR